MPICAAAGAAFLVAVLWFDLMFDVQTRGHGAGTLRAEVLASIRGYYRRVTTEAVPMNRLITLVMALTVLSIVIEIARHAAPWWASWTSLAVALSGIGLAATRTVPDAVRLGRGDDPIDLQSRLAARDLSRPPLLPGGHGGCGWAPARGRDPLGAPLDRRLRRGSPSSQALRPRLELLARKPLIEGVILACSEPGLAGVRAPSGKSRRC